LYVNITNQTNEALLPTPVVTLPTPAVPVIARTAVIVVAAYIAAQMLADIASLKVVGGLS
jgi:hypothetical protein